MTRYFFILPDVDTPVGGVNVALQMVQFLCDAGYEAAAVYSSSGYAYRYFDTPQPAYYHPSLTKVPDRVMSRRGRFQSRVKDLGMLTKPPANIRLKVAPDDVFVIPEFLYPEYSALFPDNRQILLAQDVFGYCSALQRDIQSGAARLPRFEAVVTTSVASQVAVMQFGGRHSYLVPLAVARDGLVPRTPKKRQIAYMPRKRAHEAGLFLGCLQHQPAFVDWTFCRIENVDPVARDKMLNESLIFLAFSLQEGFGLPPAEAMAAGCIVIGYTGVGGDEYFGPETGIPIADSDIAAFAGALEATVKAYQADPTDLDTLRLHAADQIAGRYTAQIMRDKLLAAWAEIDA